MDFLRKHVRTWFLEKRRDAAPESRSGEGSDRVTTAPRIQITGKIDKKVFRDALNEDVDFSVAAEAPSRVEAHYGGDATSQNFTRTQRHFFLDATGAERADRASVFANQESRARSSVARTFRAHERGQCERLATTFIKRTKNVVNFLQMSFSIVIGSSRTRTPVAW